MQTNQHFAQHSTNQNQTSSSLYNTYICISIASPKIQNHITSLFYTFKDEGKHDSDTIVTLLDASHIETKGVYILVTSESRGFKSVLIKFEPDWFI